MNRPALILLSLIAACLAAGWGILTGHLQTGAAKKEKEPILARLSEPRPAASTSARKETGLDAVSSELLPLSSAMRRMQERERAQTPTPEESERFWKEFSVQRASLPARAPDFVRKDEAQWVGTDHPEDTFQSALWALHHRRLDAFLQLLAPETAERIQRQVGDSPNKFFDEAAAIPAMRLSDQKFFGAATIKAQLDLGPEDREPRTIFFFLLDGQWKIVLGDTDVRFTP